MKCSQMKDNVIARQFQRKHVSLIFPKISLCPIIFRYSYDMKPTLFFHSKLPEISQKLFLSHSVALYASFIAKHALYLDFLQVPGSLDEIVQFYVRCRDKDEKYQIIRNNYHLLERREYPGIIYSQVYLHNS